MTIILDGTKPLWPIFGRYTDFINQHADEITNAVFTYDENATLLAELVMHMRERVNDADFRAGIIVTTERYISDYHPEIAQIKGGYPKEVHD